MLEIHDLALHDLDDLLKEASADKHNVLYPTHTIKEERRICGYISLCTTPLVHFWLHSSCRAMESFRLIKKAEELAMKTVKQGSIVVACAKDSPFYTYMPKLGFTNLGETTLNLKVLKKD